ncbi:MAG: serine/threonine protein kinase [Myxococcales bacterium]|nr:serine/threonine protein kinase [Myxococcales bacterium]
MGDRVFDDDRATVDLGPRPLENLAPADDLGGDDGVEATHSLDSAQRQPPVDPVHALPTQQLGKPKSTTMTRLSESRTTASPIAAMKLDEIERTRVFLRVALACCVFGALIALMTSGDPVAQRVVVIGSALGAIGSLWILSITRDHENYAQRRVIVPGIMLVAGAMSGVYYWGTASPVAAMLVYGIYFFSLGASRMATAGIYLLIALIHGVLGFGIAAGLLVDRGIISMGALQIRDQMAIVLIIEFLYLIAFVTARQSQKVTLDAMSSLELAVRGVANREALLAEARAELDRALKVGGPGRFTEQVVGTFRLGVLIGRGGMGEVYEAHGVSDRREAAVKLLHHGTLADPTSVQRFIREAQTTAKLDCPYIVRVLEVGTTSGEIPFLAMERLRGHDLAHQLRRQRRLQLPNARTVCEQVALGLEAARSAGIVHRDLKPHNVFLSEVGGVHRWKILDFGVSKSGGSGTLTQGHVIGTPAYMAPEQARGEDVDHRADVYSLAAILYRSITGHPAFTGKDVPTTLYEVVYRIPTQPSVLAPLPTDVDRVLAIGLAKDPKDRFETALELAEWFGLAVESRLSPEQRARADELIVRQPWGTRPAISK